MGRKKLITSAEESLSQLGDKDSLSDILVQDINKKLGNTAFILGEQEAPTDIKILVSTGSTILDTILTNGKWRNNGLPIRRLVECSGNTSAGKSLLANTVLINTQKMGGIPILFDEENSTDVSLLVRMGLKVGKEAENSGVHKLVYLSAGNVESVFDAIESTIKKIREVGSKDFITIVWDSIAATPSKQELEGSFEQEGYGMEKAKAISKGMRKITQFIGKEDVLLLFTNQLRSSVGGFGFGAEKYSTPGGHAIPFHSSIRIRLSKITDIKKGDAVVGVTVQAHTRKNKIAPPARKCKFDIYFDHGIDDESSWFDNLIEKEIIKKKNNITRTIQLSEELGGLIEFKSSEWKTEVLNSQKRIDYVREQVIKANIIDYSNLTPSLLMIDETENEEKLNAISEEEIDT